MTVIPKDLTKIMQFKKYYPTHTLNETKVKFGWTVHVINHFRDKFNLRKAKRSKCTTKRYGVGTVLEQEPLNYTILDFDKLNKMICRATGEVSVRRAGRNYNSKSMEAKNNSIKKI